LSDDVYTHLSRLSKVLKPHCKRIDAAFLRKMRSLHFDSREIEELLKITTTAAVGVWHSGSRPIAFFEQVSSAGQRLGNLNVPPQNLVQALQEHRQLIAPIFAILPQQDAAQLNWLVEQLEFSVVLILNEAYFQVREVETQILHQISEIELESQNLDVLYRRILETLTRGLKADAGHVFLLDVTKTEWQLKASTARAVSNDASASVPNTSARKDALRKQLCLTTRSRRTYLLDPGWAAQYPCTWSFPLELDGKTIGAFQLGFKVVTGWLPRQADLLSVALDRCVLAAEKLRLLEDVAARESQLRQLAEHMLHVEEMERRRISRELHDEAGQSLICIRLLIELIEMSLPPGSGDLETKLREAKELTERTILDMRRLIADLSPVVLEQFGLQAALRQLVKRFRTVNPCRVRLRVSKLIQLPVKLQMIVYRIIQECCNNISKHSLASNVNILLSSADGVLRLLVQDDGIGFDVETALAKTDSFGLAGIRERVALLGGTFSINTTQSTGKKGRKQQRGGTEVEVELPIPEEKTVGEVTRL